MKCPKCAFITSNRNDLCPRCTFDLRIRKKELGIKIHQPNASVEDLIQQLELQSTPASEAGIEPQVLPSAEPDSDHPKQRGILGRLFGKGGKSSEEAEGPSIPPPENVFDLSSDNELPPLEEATPDAGEIAAEPEPAPRKKKKRAAAPESPPAREEPAADYAESDVFQFLNTLHTPAEEFSESLQGSLEDKHSRSEPVRQSQPAPMLRSEAPGMPMSGPKVLEFGDDMDFDGALDEMLGDTSLDVTAVAMEPLHKPKRKSDEEDFEFSFDFGDDDEGDGDEETLFDEEQAVPEMPEEMATEGFSASASNDSGDPFLDALMSNLHSLEAQSNQFSISEQEAAGLGASSYGASAIPSAATQMFQAIQPGSPPPAPQPTFQRPVAAPQNDAQRIERLRRAQEIMAKVAATDQDVVGELSAVLADAYGLNPETFAPPPPRPELEFEVADREEVMERAKVRERLAKFRSTQEEAPSEIQSLESMLQGEVQALCESGTKVLSVDDLNADPENQASPQPEGEALPPTVTASQEHLLSVEASLLQELNSLEEERGALQAAQELEIIEENIDLPPAHSLLTAAHLSTRKYAAPTPPPNPDSLPNAIAKGTEQELDDELSRLLGESSGMPDDAPLAGLGTPDLTHDIFSDIADRTPPLAAESTAPSEPSASPQMPEHSEDPAFLSNELDALLGAAGEIAEENDQLSEEAAPEAITPLLHDELDELDELLGNADTDDAVDFSAELETDLEGAMGMPEESPASAAPMALSGSLLSQPDPSFMEFEVAGEEPAAPDAELATMADDVQSAFADAAFPPPSSELPTTGEAALLEDELAALLGEETALEQIDLPSVSIDFQPAAEATQDIAEHVLAELPVQEAHDESVSSIGLVDAGSSAEGALPEEPETIEAGHLQLSEPELGLEQPELLAELEALTAGEPAELDSPSLEQPAALDGPSLEPSAEIEPVLHRELGGEASLLADELESLLGELDETSTEPAPALPVLEEPLPSMESPLEANPHVESADAELSVIAELPHLAESLPLLVAPPPLWEPPSPAGDAVSAPEMASESGSAALEMTDSQSRLAAQLDELLADEVVAVQQEPAITEVSAELDHLLSEQSVELPAEEPVDDFLMQESDILLHVRETALDPLESGGKRMAVQDSDLPVEEIADAGTAESPAAAAAIRREEESHEADLPGERNAAQSAVDEADESDFEDDDEFEDDDLDDEFEDVSEESELQNDDRESRISGLWERAAFEVFEAQEANAFDGMEISAGELSTLAQSATIDVLFQSAVEEWLDPEKRRRRVEGAMSGLHRKIDGRELETAVLVYQREEKVYRSKQAERRMRPARTLDEIKLAGRSARLVAGLLDLLIVVGTVTLMNLFLIFPESIRVSAFFLQAPPIDDLLPNLFTSLHITLIFWLIARALTVMGYGAGPGGRLMKLEVVDYEGRALGPKQALLRALSEMTVPLTLGLGLLPMFGKTRRTLHDYLAKTIVSKRTELPHQKKEPERVMPKKGQQYRKGPAKNLTPKVATATQAPQKGPPNRPRPR